MTLRQTGDIHKEVSHEGSGGEGAFQLYVAYFLAHALSAFILLPFNCFQMCPPPLFFEKLGHTEGQLQAVLFCSLSAT